MVNAFRGLMLLSIALFFVAAFLPFDHPMEVDVPLDQAPPTWFFALLAFVVVLLAAAVASIGLLRLRRWGRTLAIAVAVCGAMTLWLLVGSPVAAAVSGTPAPLLGLAALAWLVAVGLSYHPSVAPCFRA